MNIAIIPARGGSKRIPNKNIKEFNGKPIIAYSIEAAVNSLCFDKVIVSTDDLEIAAVSKSYGAEVPFMRPAELSDDYQGTTPVIAHAINWLKLHNEVPKQVCCIYATAPFIRADDIKRGHQILEETQCDFAFSVTNYAFPIQRSVRITDDNRVEMFDATSFNIRSQDLEEAYHDAGQFYWGLSESWLTQKMIFSRDSAPVNLPRYRVQDIDTQEDWERAEIIFKLLQQWKGD